MPLSSVPVPSISDDVKIRVSYNRRPPEDYSEPEKESLFLELVAGLTRLRRQRRVETALRTMVVAAAISPQASTTDVVALALSNWYWQQRDRLGWNELEPAIAEARRLDSDIDSRRWRLTSLLEQEETGNQPSVDAIGIYWLIPDHYLYLLKGGESADERALRLMGELSDARKAAAELSRHAIDLLSETRALEEASQEHVATLIPPLIAEAAREQILELKDEADRLNARAEDYRARSAQLLQALNEIRPGYSNHDGVPTPRVVLPLEVQREIHDRDGGRCVKCGSTFKLQLDHVVPVSLGGSNEPTNLQLLCMECNTKKGNRYVG